MKSNSDLLFLNEDENELAQNAISYFLEKQYKSDILSVSQKVDMATLGSSLIVKLKLQVIENADNE